MPSNCIDERGGVFDTSLSTSWVDQGLYGINGVQYGFEANLGYNMNADYGHDTVGLGYSAGLDGPTLENQTVGAYGMAAPLFT